MSAPISNRYSQLLKLVESASKVFEISDIDIMFKESSKRPISEVRDTICHIAIKQLHLEVSMSVLVQFTGRKHHSSIYHSLHKAESLLFYDRKFQQRYKETLNGFIESISSQYQHATT